MDDTIAPFVGALIKEISFLGRSVPGLPVHTVFFGGGTPSLLTVEQYRSLFQAIKQCFSLAPDAEMSLEANPNDLTFDYLQGLCGAGFNRISIGMQSANPRDLQMFQRRHDHSDVIKAVRYAREAGFENLNLDLIFGVPNQTLQDWQETVKQALELDPDHLSLYGLELKGGTALRLAVDAGDLPAPDEDLAADMYEFASEEVGRAGYRQYEISNWSRPGMEARHNLQYWRNLPYIGLGPGAHGYANDVRYSVITFPPRYIEAMQQKRENLTGLEYPRTPATARATLVDRDTEMEETILMGLRLVREGIQRHNFKDRFGVDLVDLKSEEINRLVKLDLLHVDDNRICLTDQGRFVSNAVIGELI